MPIQCGMCVHGVTLNLVPCTQTMMGLAKKKATKKKKKKIIKERLGVDDQHNQIERSIIMSTGRAQGTFEMHNE